LNCKFNIVQSGIATEAALADELSEAKCRLAKSLLKLKSDRMIVSAPSRFIVIFSFWYLSIVFSPLLQVSVAISLHLQLVEGFPEQFLFV
jgi:hypothetical protein